MSTITIDEIVLSQTAREALDDCIHFDDVGERISRATTAEEMVRESLGVLDALGWPEDRAA